MNPVELHQANYTLTLPSLCNSKGGVLVAFFYTIAPESINVQYFVSIYFPFAAAFSVMIVEFTD